MVDNPYNSKDKSSVCECYGLNCVLPSIRMLTSPPPAPQNVTAFGDEVFKKVVKVKWSYEAGP